MIDSGGDVGVIGVGVEDSAGISLVSEVVAHGLGGGIGAPIFGATGPDEGGPALVVGGLDRFWGAGAEGGAEPRFGGLAGEVLDDAFSIIEFLGDLFGGHVAHIGVGIGVVGEFVAAGGHFFDPRGVLFGPTAHDEHGGFDAMFIEGVEELAEMGGVAFDIEAEVDEAEAAAVGEVDFLV